MAQRVSGVKASVGFVSETGPRQRNEDFAGAVFGPELPEPRRDVMAAIADGIGSTKGGREAAEIAVRGFLDGICDLPETMEVRRAAAIVLNALNGWIHSQGQRDPGLMGMGCTFTAMVLRGRIAHVLHVGDTRAYRLSRDRLTCLTADHVRQGGAGRSNILTRALGVETEVRLDYTSQPVAQHDRFLLCSDGVHGILAAETIAGIMRERVSSEDTARALVAAALEAGSTDNCTALVLDVVGLETAESAEIGANIAQLPLIPVPLGGETIDGPGRQTSLYTVMPLYQGELLETRLARRPALGLEEGRNIAIKLARAAAALHRAGIVHRDIKPDNVILEAQGALKLIDLGVVRVPGMEDAPPEDTPGTVAYMAPEMFDGEPGNEATDIYALGVTMFRAFTGEFPYGNPDATSPPRRDRPTPLSALRLDLPAWLQAALGRAVAIDPMERFRDMAEFTVEMEAGPARAPLAAPRPRTLYERNPLRFWQGVAALLAFALLLSLLPR